MKKNKQGKCKLCHINTELCYSHIIPKFVFKKIKYGSKDFILKEDGKRETLKVQREYREYILCLKCEKLISKNETYISNVLYNYKKIITPDNDRITIQKVNYKRFKLFQLSILWRGSVSAYDAFENGKLEPEHAEKLRLMILNQDPGEEYEFGCKLFGITLQNKLQTQLIINPGNFSIKSYKIIHYTFGGFKWHFILANDWEKIPNNYWSIHKNNELYFILRDMFDFPDFNNFILGNFPIKL